ncbi:putative T7SS-secreted protein [Streptomyces pharetrae]|uniref:putative T7SS-secreted protein n=1 Tax=Streptomyces pharetrae TaxID=291370 RepID=UPI00335ED19B
MTETHFRRRAWIAATDTVQDWVPGKPSELDQLIKKLAGTAAHFGQGAEQLRKLNTDPWQGEAAEVFRDTVKRLPKDLDTALDAFVAAGLAVLAYRNVLDGAQRLTRRILENEAPTARELSRAYDKAVSDHDASVKAGDTAAARPPETDPGKTLMAELVGMIEAARKDVEEAAATAKRELTKAAEKAPNRPSAWSRFKGGAKEAVNDFADLAIAVNPGRLLTEPGAYLHDGAMLLDGGIAAVRDPVAFSKDFYQGATNTWDAFEKDPVRMLGYLAPSLAGGAVVGGSAGLARRLDGVDGTGRATGLGTGADHVNGAEPGTYSEDGHRSASNPTDPVDLATGRMYLPQTDLTLPGVLPLVFKRRAQSGYRAGRWFGPSWSNTVDQRLEIDAERIVFVHEDGLILAYPRPETDGAPALPAEGPRWPLRRDPEGYRITDPATGRVWHFEDQTDDHARLEQIDDRNGNWITFEYASDGTPLALTHSGGYRVRITTEDHRITALHLAGAAPDGTDQELIRYGYSEAGDLTEVVNSSGVPLRFTYDEAGRITSWTDTNDRGYTYEYDDRDRCIAEGGAAGHMSLRLEYGGRDPETGLRTTTATTTGTGHVHRYLVNDLSQVVAEIDPLGAVTRFERDRHHRVLSRTDPLGHVTSLRYDDAGNLVSVVRADGRESTAEYDELGRPVRVRNTDGTTVLQTYDERGNRTSVTRPSGETTRFTYTDAGHLTSVTDPLGHTTTIRCDAAGLPVEITDPLGAATRYERDAFGRPVAVTDPTGSTTRLAWTVEGRLSRRTAPDGTTETWTYDGEGNCTSHTDPLGGVSRFEYTHFDLLTSRTGPDGVRYDFDHDLELRLTKVTNPQGLTWSYEYDAAGQLIAETDFDDRRLTYAYDAAGRLASRANALGETISFERNALGQVIRKDAAGRATTFTYDTTDQLARAAGPDGTTLTLSRDEYGRLLAETVDDRTLTYTYDPLGRRTGRGTPAGATTTWTYDAAGRRTGMVASGRAIDFTYDEAGRELSRRIGETVTLEHGFDDLGRLMTQSVTGAGGARLQHRTYTYRADGNLTGVDDQLSGPRRFDLDPVGRVTAVHAANWTETYAYDAAGNQTSASWPSSHPGAEAVGDRQYAGTRITRAGRVRYEHDELGRIVLRQKTRLSRKPDTWRYEWDAEDRLTSVTTPDGTRWRYTYDPLGRRTAKLRLAEDGETVVEQVVFTWDGTTLCEQTTTSPTLPHPVTLTWDHQGLRPLAQTERLHAADAPQEEIDSRFFAIVTDLVGTPSELVDEQGEIAWRTRSTLWGTTAWAADSTTYTPLRFPGQYYDPETGLHYNYFRHYDPETARYLSIDPLGLAPSPNPASYVANPHVWADPLGLAPAGCPEEEHLFRGTSTGFNASDNTQASGFTPTSTDPGVATAFARHSEQFGESVVQLIPRSAIDGIDTMPGYIRSEAEIGVNLPASELARRAAVQIPSGAAHAILADMGIYVPRLKSYGDISDALEWDIPKLSPEQVRQFVAEAYRHG